MDRKGVIVITECPKCGKMQAARTPLLETLKDANGDPDPDRGMLMKMECLGCIEFAPPELPGFGWIPVALSSRISMGLLGVLAP